jgi:hypothetical protein
MAQSHTPIRAPEFPDFEADEVIKVAPQTAKMPFGTESNFLGTNQEGLCPYLQAMAVFSLLQRGPDQR